MKTEQLQSGQGAPQLGAAPQSAELNAGGQASHGENTRGGSAMYLRGLAEGEHGTSLFGATPQVEHAGGQAEMGGGGDPIDDWVVKKGGYDNLLKLIQQNGWGDSLVWKLDDGTKLSVAEVRRRAATSPTPEPQPPPRPGDWKANLPPDQRQRLQTFEAKIANFDAAQLQIMLMRLKELQAVAPIDGWQSKEIMEGDAGSCLKILNEKLVEIGGRRRPIETESAERDLLVGLSPEARAHVDGLIKRFEKEQQLNNVSLTELARLVQEEYRKAGLIGRNVPEWLFPPVLKPELLRLFNLPPEIPVQGNGGRE